MSHTIPRKPYPRSFTDRQLAKVNVEIANEYSLILRCTNCGDAWQPQIQTGGKLPHGYWKCPRGCNE